LRDSAVAVVARREPEVPAAADRHEPLDAAVNVRPAGPAGRTEPNRLMVVTGASHAAAVARQLPEFKEKPPRQTAEAYLDSGEYLWNASMLLWRTDVMLAELERRAVSAGSTSATSTRSGSCWTRTARLGGRPQHGRGHWAGPGRAVPGERAPGDRTQ